MWGEVGRCTVHQCEADGDLPVRADVRRTRKSSDKGLDQDYNSIDAQRDAGHAYIASQRAEGWIPVAAVVRRLFLEFPGVGSTTQFVQQLRLEGVTTKLWVAQSGKDRVGKLLDKGALYKILNNPVYRGQLRHKGVSHPGEHEALVTPEQWESVQTALASKPTGIRPALKGLIFTSDSYAMTPHATKGRGGRLYRYYLSTRDAKQGHGASAVRMLPAGDVEAAVVAQLRGILQAPEMVMQVWRELSKHGGTAADMTETQVSVALSQIDVVWEQLFPLEQHRIVQLLVERIVVSPDELQVRLRPNGIENLAFDMITPEPQANRRKAA